MPGSIPVKFGTITPPPMRGARLNEEAPAGGTQVEASRSFDERSVWSAYQTAPSIQPSRDGSKKKPREVSYRGWRNV